MASQCMMRLLTTIHRGRRYVNGGCISKSQSQANCLSLYGATCSCHIRFSWSPSPGICCRPCYMTDVHDIRINAFLDGGRWYIKSGFDVRKIEDLEKVATPVSNFLYSNSLFCEEQSFGRLPDIRLRVKHRTASISTITSLPAQVTDTSVHLVAAIQPPPTHTQHSHAH